MAGNEKKTERRDALGLLIMKFIGDRRWMILGHSLPHLCLDLRVKIPIERDRCDVEFVARLSFAFVILMNDDSTITARLLRKVIGDVETIIAGR